MKTKTLTTEGEILRDGLEKISTREIGAHLGLEMQAVKGIATDTIKRADKIKWPSEEDKKKMISAMNHALWELEWFVGTVEGRKTKELHKDLGVAISELKKYMGLE